MRLRFKDRSPAWAKILVGILFLNTTLELVTAFAIPRWAPVQPDTIHSYAIHFRGGPTFFVQPWLGAYFEYGLYAGFALLGLFLLLLWFNRDQLERIS